MSKIFNVNFKAFDYIDKNRRKPDNVQDLFSIDCRLLYFSIKLKFGIYSMNLT